MVNLLSTTISPTSTSLQDWLLRFSHNRHWLPKLFVGDCHWWIIERKQQSSAMMMTVYSNNDVCRFTHITPHGNEQNQKLVHRNQAQPTITAKSPDVKCAHISDASAVLIHRLLFIFCHWGVAAASVSLSHCIEGLHKTKSYRT